MKSNLVNSPLTDEQVQSLLMAFAKTRPDGGLVESEIRQVLRWIKNGTHDKRFLGLLLNGRAQITRFRNGEPLVALGEESKQQLALLLAARRAAFAGDAKLLHDTEGTTGPSRIASGDNAPGTSDHGTAGATGTSLDDPDSIDWAVLFLAYARSGASEELSERDFAELVTWASRVLISQACLSLLLDGSIYIMRFEKGQPRFVAAEAGRDAPPSTVAPRIR